MITYEDYFGFKNQGLKRAEIADKFGIPDWKLKKIIAANNWGKMAPVVEFENAFKELDEFACYWAGFIAADGNVDSKNRVRIMLKYDDTTHLHKFRDFIGSTHSISSNTSTYNRSSLEFTSRTIVEDLKNLFYIVPNKTEILDFPNISDECLKHYIRGYFDGDGSICESFSNVNSITATLYTTFTSGSPVFTNKLFEALQRILGVVGHLQTFKDKNSFQIKFNTNDSIKLLRWIYTDAAVYLDRKYNLYVKTVIDNNRKIR